MHKDTEPAPQNDRLIGTREYGLILGLSRSGVIRKERAGDIPAPVIAEGNVKRYSFNEAQAYVLRKKRERDERLAARSQQQQVAA